MTFRAPTIRWTETKQLMPDENALVNSPSRVIVNEKGEAIAFLIVPANGFQAMRSEDVAASSNMERDLTPVPDEQAANHNIGERTCHTCGKVLATKLGRIGHEQTHKKELIHAGS